jgi:hypothetical protein
MQLKHYRDQLAGDILSIASFGKISEKCGRKWHTWRKFFWPTLGIAPEGSGERQSKR